MIYDTSACYSMHCLTPSLNRRVRVDAYMHSICIWGDRIEQQLGFCVDENAVSFVICLYRHSVDEYSIYACSYLRMPYRYS